MVGLTNWNHETINPNSTFNKIHREFNLRYEKYILANDKNIDVNKIFDEICINYNFEKIEKLFQFIKKIINIMMVLFLEAQILINLIKL